MSQAMEVGNRLVELCQQGKNLEAIDTLYSEIAVSIEPVVMDPMPARSEGIEAIRGKNKWWAENHEVHRGDVKGPYPHGDDRFACYFSYEVTNKPSGRRMQMDEIGLFTLVNGKIQQEEFFYHMGG